MTPLDAKRPTTLGKHRILLEIGEGGMSNVYLAVARGPSGFQKLLVLKVLRAGLASDPEFREMALSEARIAARLNHTNVVQTYEVVNDDARPIIVMEYLDGQSLSSVLSSAADTFTFPMRLRVLVDALAGLQHAHDLANFDGKPFNLVHRDFTPQNIFIAYDGHVKVLDFGIAKTSEKQSNTLSGTLKGKVRYMSPEQIAGAPPLDRRADIFSAGMVLWELVTGHSPWNDTTDIAVINHVINAEIPALRSAAPDVPEEIERIVTKALQFDPGNRYATAVEMATDLERFLLSTGGGPLARDIGKVVSDQFTEVHARTKETIEAELAKIATDDAAAVAGTHSGQSLDAAGQRSRRGRTGLGLLAAAAVATGCVAVFLVTRHSGVPDPSPSSAAAPGLPAASASASAVAALPAPDEGAERQVEIHLKAIPGSATLFFDGERLETNPAALVKLADHSLHTVRADAPGYASRAVQVAIDNGADLVLTLDRVPTGGTARPAASNRPKPDCNPPYYVDDQGFKKFKPHCI